MSMQHRAYVFDYAAFDTSLRPILERALVCGVAGPLIMYIDDNLERLKDPYEGAQLDGSWLSQVEPTDIQELGEYALTGFYDPSSSVGLRQDWYEVDGLLTARLGSDEALTGHPLAANGTLFDPGFLGSYFQSEGEVREHLTDVMTLNEARLRRLERMLRTAAEQGRGLYVTF